jgi:hypothetical protein
MIAPEFRGCQPIDLKGPAKKFIEKNHGAELWEALQPSLIEVENIKREICSAGMYKCDVEQLKKFMDLFAKNYNNSMLLNKYFSFGSGAQQLAVKFTWADSFCQDPVQSFSPVFDALSCKYNVGVCLARLGCYMNLEGDGIKHACKYMQQAAWVFEDLKSNVS